MGKNKMIAKGCPKCEQHVPVACKACPCGHSFFIARKNKVQMESGDDIRRRTQRVRREKPDYYDILEYDKQIKRTKLRNSECEVEGDPSKPRRKKHKKDEEDDDEVITSMSAEKQLQCSLILAELNRKMQIVTWKPNF